LTLCFAYKSLHECDQPCINRFVASLLDMPVLQLNLIERTLFASLDYNVHVPQDDIIAKREEICRQVAKGRAIN
jgi:hypothetical protein